MGTVAAAFHFVCFSSSTSSTSFAFEIDGTYCFEGGDISFEDVNLMIATSKIGMCFAHFHTVIKEGSKVREASKN